MTNSDLAYQRQQYTRRNAFAAGVESLLRSNAKQEEFKLTIKNKHDSYETSRVQTTEWMSGFFMDCTGLSRKAEDAVVEEAKVLFPKLRVTVSRKTTLRPRFVEFAF